MEEAAMSAKAMMDRFIQKSPLAVMTRCIAQSLMGDKLDEIFQQNRTLQYDDTIKFSTIAMSMAEIALGTVENRNQAYREYKDELQTSVVAYYGKLNRTEPKISEALVRYSADQATSLLKHLDFQEWEVLPGYRCFSIDGNHLQKTEKRLKETRGLCAAPLPGTVVARFDHQTGLFDQAYLLEDGHAQESTVLDRAIADIESKALLIADRHFCIVSFMLKVSGQCGAFLIRHHGRLKGQLLGKREFAGKIASGRVYEQAMEISTADQTLVVRRITLELVEPTRDGDMEIHILSNVPKDDANGCVLADLYRSRWEIENAFYILTMTLNCESKANCYPRCALFQFCMAMFAYNCRQVLLAALYAEHKQESVEAMSQYQIAKDIVGPMEGMQTAITDEEWEVMIPKRAEGMAQLLREISRKVDIRSYRKSVRGPKQPTIKRKRCKAGTHVATHKLLKARNQRC
jgi:Transposase DDE domain